MRVMLGIDISTLSFPELRRLLVLAQDRGQATLAARISTELAARGAGGQPAPAALRVPVVGDAEVGSWPIEAPEIVDDAWADPLDLELGIPDPDPGPHPGPSPRLRPATAPRRDAWPLGVAAGVLATASIAWGLTSAPRLLRSPAGQPPPPARVMVARAAPPPSAATPPAPPAPPTIRTAATAPGPALRRLDPCARPPSAADRLVCNDLALQLLDHELRQAYSRALAQTADPEVVRAGQAAWRQARDDVDDPHRLAQLYDRRIRDLAAATAATVEPQ